MWNNETDIFEALDEHDFECESTDDFFDLDFDSDIVECIEENPFDEEDAQVDYDD